jgi:hypothetical protein
MKAKASISAQAAVATTSMLINHQILMSTAVVQDSGVDGCPIICKALLDSGSQSYFMTKSLAQTIKVAHQKTIKNACLCEYENVTTVKT